MIVLRKKCSWILTAVVWVVVVVTSYYVTTLQQPVSCRGESSEQLSRASNDRTEARINPSPLNPSSPARRQLLLVSYGRSGSSFTSAIISHDPDVFLIFEPLHAFNDDLYGDTVTEKTQQRVFSIIKAFLDCDFGSLDPNLFSDVLFQSSSSTEQLHYCLANKNLSGHSHVECFLSTWNSCHTHRLTLIKTIRFRAEWAEYFLSRFQNLKILYLVRDVRAVLHSQVKHFQNTTRKEQAAEEAGKFCPKLVKDFKIVHKLNSRFPERVKGIRYEDGCLDPENYARAIYTFAGLVFTNITKQYLQEITKSNTTRAGLVDPYSVVRQDSVQAMNNWRQAADYEVVNKIDEVCKEAHSLFGYRPVRSQQDLLSGLFLFTSVSNELFSALVEQKTP